MREFGPWIDNLIRFRDRSPDKPDFWNFSFFIEVTIFDQFLENPELSDPYVKDRCK